VSISKDTYAATSTDESDPGVDPVYYLSQPLTVTLTWTGLGDVDLSLSYDDYVSANKNRDITSPPGGEVYTISSPTDKAFLIYARRFTGTSLQD